MIGHLVPGCWRGGGQAVARQQTDACSSTDGDDVADHVLGPPRRRFMPVNLDNSKIEPVEVPSKLKLICSSDSLSDCPYFI